MGRGGCSRTPWPDQGGCPRSHESATWPHSSGACESRTCPLGAARSGSCPERRHASLRGRGLEWRLVGCRKGSQGQDSSSALALSLPCAPGTPATLRGGPGPAGRFLSFRVWTGGRISGPQPCHSTEEEVAAPDHATLGSQASAMGAREGASALAWGSLGASGSGSTPVCWG